MDEWMPAISTREQALMPCLEAIVEFLQGPLCQLTGNRRCIECGSDAAQKREQARDAAQLATECLGDLRILDLQCDDVPARQARSVHLANRRRRRGRVLEIFEER